ncbi:GNAT family N-acetyltransferase [Lentzea sp. BCCO 10_0798]|uniref:GNAT family N-acetyltransferase n=1 Tax=Lentzea kristufekii TaxID=3095430 RepID=A0ABU4TJN0_9PSEU|nr:GNAT family N-acetyltransferase [Lentzea sp. BCCO 10_0798]MDX8048474.1 GNAT family N-acetyltransferase [Lentzea sp. BCCO 10_0798]
MAALHVRALPMGLFPRLGEQFVARWHRAYLDSPHAVALVAVRRTGAEEDVVGFLVGATDRLSFHRELLRNHRTALAVRGGLALVTRPAVLSDFTRTRLRPYLRRISGSSEPPVPKWSAPRAPVADLTAVAVATVARRGGAGRRLVETFLTRCAASGTRWAELVTALEPGGAQDFYASTGWSVLHDVVTRDGVSVRHFARRLDLPEGS